MAGALKRIAGLMQERCCAYASQYVVPLADGTILGPVEKITRRISAPGALQVLKAEYGDIVAEAAVQPAGITQTSLRNAIKSHPSELSVDKEVKRAMVLLEKAGAITVSRSQNIEPHKPERGRDA
jgi:hypothetical protein